MDRSSLGSNRLKCWIGAMGSLITRIPGILQHTTTRHISANRPYTTCNHPATLIPRSRENMLHIYGPLCLKFADNSKHKGFHCQSRMQYTEKYLTVTGKINYKENSLKGVLKLRPPCYYNHIFSGRLSSSTLYFNSFHQGFSVHMFI